MTRPDLGWWRRLGLRGRITLVATLLFGVGVVTGLGDGVGFGVGVGDGNGKRTGIGVRRGAKVGSQASSISSNFSSPAAKPSNGQASAARYWNSRKRRSLPEKFVAEPCTART